MKETDRSQIQRFVWEQMKRLEQAGLGRRDDQRTSRDNFILRDNLLPCFTSRDIREGFIRSDKSHGLLFRGASEAFIAIIPADWLRDAREHKHGGPEFRLSVLDERKVASLFDLVLRMAAGGTV